MKVGIIVAMEKELKFLLPLIENKREYTERGTRFIEGKMSGHHITVCQCGIGKVNSALSTLTLIEQFSLDLVINTGVAGGADKSMHVLDLFIAKGVAYHDVWCGPGTEYGAAHGFDVILKPAEKICRIAGDLLPAGEKTKFGLICSGDKFITTAEEIKEIKNHFPEAVAVDMESASIAQVCVLKGVPFNIIRVISDTPGENENISQYENFWSDAPRETFEALKMILKKL